MCASRSYVCGVVDACVCLYQERQTEIFASDNANTTPEVQGEHSPSRDTDEIGEGVHDAIAGCEVGKNALISYFYLFSLIFLDTVQRVRHRNEFTPEQTTGLSHLLNVTCARPERATNNTRLLLLARPQC